MVETEDFIKRYKHIPGMPPAKEIEESEGVELGEMNRKLLEKIEELILHIIELSKPIEGLETKVK